MNTRHQAWTHALLFVFFGGRLVETFAFVRHQWLVKCFDISLECKRWAPRAKKKKWRWRNGRYARYRSPMQACVSMQRKTKNDQRECSEVDRRWTCAIATKKVDICVGQQGGRGKRTKTKLQCPWCLHVHEWCLPFALLPSLLGMQSSLITLHSRVFVFLFLPDF